MRRGSLIFSLLKVPGFKIHCLANYRDEALHSFSTRLLGSRVYGLQGGLSSNKWNQRLVATKAGGSKRISGNTKSKSSKLEILGQEISTSGITVVNNNAKLDQLQCPEIQEIAQHKNLSDLVTVIVFDLETTGYSRVNERVIEIALRDLQGGENSTFQTLVNPQRYVPNSHVHGITTKMVNSPDIPRMEDLIPILLQYIQNRQKHRGYVLWVAHNARFFDAPFLIHEFMRCSSEVPRNWLFLDTLPLARELMKSGGRNLSSTSLAALREFYRIKVDGSAHRAMADVNALSHILPMLTSDLKLTLSCLVKKSFTMSDLMNAKK